MNVLLLLLLLLLLLPFVITLNTILMLSQTFKKAESEMNSEHISIARVYY